MRQLKWGQTTQIWVGTGIAPRQAFLLNTQNNIKCKLETYPAPPPMMKGH